MARTRTDLQIAADKRAADLRSGLADQLAQLRRDAGLTQRAVAASAGLAPSVICRLENGASGPPLETYARVAAVLGADLAAKVYPKTGAVIHDRHAVPMTDLLLGEVHARWQPHPEVRVRHPARGWIDVALHDPSARLLVATELESMLRRIEQLLRWSAEKAAGLPSAAAWSSWSARGTPEISRLLVVRWTRTNREVATTARRVLAAEYPADPRDALASLTGVGPWPGAALLWARLDTDRPALVAWRP